MNGHDALEFTIRRKVFSLFGAQFHIYNADTELIGYCKQKAFKLKEDIRVYTDETCNTEMLRIAARSVIDFSAAYDVIQSSTNTKLGVMRRAGMKSILRDEWSVLNPEEMEVGKIKEDSTGMALVRRFVPGGKLFPQKFSYTDAQSQQHAEAFTHFNPFIHRMTIRSYPTNPLDPMMMVAAGVLLMAIEGRQKG
ncbi:hypothetical protein [Lignipirellula cremea]|uniref:Tubby C 2 n=1 Tax=Lignipirellula cremea TaxID=2528010 RepID=A0A518E3A6_9BACT|nr:hypothetical protein [Lignipirellula cremea]QDU98552.1 hypothetical protein Pla8534_64210 [Lignipirellula cremea]